MPLTLCTTKEQAARSRIVTLSEHILYQVLAQTCTEQADAPVVEVSAGLTPKSGACHRIDKETRSTVQEIRIIECFCAVTRSTLSSKVMSNKVTRSVRTKLGSTAHLRLLYPASANPCTKICAHAVFHPDVPFALSQFVVFIGSCRGC